MTQCRHPKGLFLLPYIMWQCSAFFMITHGEITIDATSRMSVAFFASYACPILSSKSYVLSDIRGQDIKPTTTASASCFANHVSTRFVATGSSEDTVNHAHRSRERYPCVG